MHNTNRKPYLGFCDTYGKAKAIGAAILLPTVFNAAVRYFTGPEASALDYLISAGEGAFIGGVGGGMAVGFHKMMNADLAEKNVGWLEGSYRVKRAQLLSYVLTVAIMLPTYPILKEAQERHSRARPPTTISTPAPE